ncbi:MAG: hypothetical protein K9H41_07010 [Bacteroidia bacterium]|nr:hypothetical protein [Bacteroidia bacterium]
MKKQITKIGFALLLAISIGSCKKNNTLTAESVDSTVSTPTPNTPSTPCGQAQVQNLMAGQFINSGNVTVTNDSTNLYVTYNTVNGWQIQKTHLYVGDCDSIPNKNGNPKIGLFPYQTSNSPRVTSFTYTIALSTLHGKACYCIAAHAEVVLVDGSGNVIQSETGWGQGVSQGGNSWAMKFSYCTQSCPPPTPPCLINPGDYRTQTQGGWGSTPNGNNPGAYLHTNFAAAFPNGLVVGCGSNKITLTSAQAVTDFLPQGGTPSVLTQSYTNPVTSISVLAGQVVALKISVTLDNAIVSYGNSTTSLASLVIASGTFQGWTVGQLLAEAELILGGCASNYTASQINNAVDMVNNNFVDGTVVGTYLTCP